MRSVHAPAHRSAPSHGVALIAVLWIVAALTIIVTGLSRTVRDEVHLVASARQSVVAQALGDAAIQLVLQGMAAQPQAVNRLTYVDTVYRGVPIRVEIMPLNGLIDINMAAAPLLSRLYEVAGGAAPEAAQALAQATIETRERRDARGRPERFEAIEDLLRVPGVGYGLYARLSRLITADVRGSGRVNPMAAPEAVLWVLANGDAGLASRVAGARDSGQDGIDTTALEASFTDNSSVRRYRVQARVPLEGGAWLRTSRNVDLGASARDGMPWRTFYTERSFDPLIRKATQ